MDACDACGALDLPQDEVVHLTRPGRATIRAAGELNLCRGCLEIRSEQQWRTDGREGRLIEKALETHTRPVPNHYQYLVEEGAVLHLVRLRPEWVDAKAAAHAPPPNA